MEVLLSAKMAVELRSKAEPGPGGWGKGGKAMDLGNHVVGIKETIGIVLVFAAFLLLVRWRARRRSETIARDFLGRYPNAALLYVYLEDAPGNDGKIVSRKGTVSPIFDAGNAPDFGVKKGFACYVAPGPVELDVKASWVEDLYVGKRPRSIRTQVSFHAEPVRGYAVVMNGAGLKSKFVKLHAD